MADNLSQTVVGLGYVPVDRGDWEKNYQSNPETRYFNDNIAQYKGSAFIADVTAENAEGNAGTEDSPRYYITAKPYEESIEELNPGWKVFASDAEFAIKYFAQFFTEEENPEFCYVIVDKNKKILFGVKQDGEFYFGAGCPPQVKSYIEEKISALSLDEYESIVAFLDGLIGSDTTLKMMLDSLEENKVDKEEGKSLIDSEHADAASHIDNPEYLQVTTDSEDKVLEGIKQDGTKVIGGDLNVGGSANISGNIRVLGNMEVSGVSYKVIENPEWIKVLTDAQDRIIAGVRKDGSVYIGQLEGLDDKLQEMLTQMQQMLDEAEAEIDAKLEVFNSVFNIVDNPEWIQVTTDSEGKILEGITAEGKKKVMVETEIQDDLTTKAVSIDGTIIENIQDPEGRTEIKTDSESKILSYRDSQGKLNEVIGINTQNLKLSDKGLESLQIALNKVRNTNDWSDYISNDGDAPLCLAMPKRAIINLHTSYNLKKLSKKGRSDGVEGVNYDIPIYAEFWDMNGNYFKKKVFISGQGSSTMLRDKKNIAIDFFDSEWDGDAFKIKFGNWVSQDSFHLKAYDYETFVGVGAWTYKLYEQMAKTLSVEADHVWKKALWDTSLNSTTRAYGNSLEQTSIFDDTGARCFPDGFPCIVYQNGEFWGVFSMQLKKHRDNYHMDKATPENIHLDGFIGEGSLDANGNDANIRWDLWEIRNPKNLVYAESHSDVWKYDADVPGQFEIAGNNDGSSIYDSWSAGSYIVGKIVEHGGHIFLNTVAGNTKEPVYHSKNNSDSSPDFKNKTKCGWLNVTNTVKVKEYILDFTRIMTKIDTKEAIYLADQTEENLAAMKAELETYFDVDNLIDYIIINDVVRNDDAFWNNWQWTTYNGIKWWCNLYDCNISFGYSGGTDNTFRAPATGHISRGQVRSDFMLRYIITYYSDRLNQRWADLRQAKVLDGNNIYAIAKKWIDDISLDFFNLENEKWGYVKCIDNMMRIKKWIDVSITNLDNVYNYNQN